MTRNKRITAAIEAINEDAYTPVHYPGAVDDPDTGTLVSDAEVAETPYTLHLGPGQAHHHPADRAPGRRPPATRMRCFRYGAITRS